MPRVRLYIRSDITDRVNILVVTDITQIIHTVIDITESIDTVSDITESSYSY